MVRRKAVIGTSVVAAVALIGTGATAASITAPGFHINSTNIGTMTTSHAEKTLTNTINDYAVVINGKKFTYKDLGISYDDKTLNNIVDEHKAWNVSAWNDDSMLPIHIDEKVLNAAVQKSESYKAPVNAGVVFSDSEDQNQWVITPSEKGKNVDVEDLKKKIQDAVQQQKHEITYDLVDIEPAITDDKAQEFTNSLNEKLEKAGFYIGDDKVVGITPVQYSQMMNVEVEKNDFVIKVNEDKVQEIVNSIPEKVNKPSDDGSAVVDENGKVLKTLDSWADGYVLKDTEGLKNQVVESLKNNSPAEFALNGEVAPASVNKLFRKAVVVKADRKVYLYENDQKVAEYPVAIGKPGTETDSGSFHVFDQLEVTKMGCTPRYDYCTPNVKWVSYYNGGEAFHGTYWHNDFGDTDGSLESHGCVNMRENDAKDVYKFLQVGSLVVVE